MAGFYGLSLSCHLCTATDFAPSNAATLSKDTGVAEGKILTAAIWRVGQKLGVGGARGTLERAIEDLIHWARLRTSVASAVSASRRVRFFLS